MKKTLVVLNLVLIIISCNRTDSSTVIQNFKKTSEFYDNIIHSDNINIASLNQFMAEMPKGGDIHHHYTGSIYAETYLDWVKSKGWKINSCTFKIEPEASNNTTCKFLSVDELKKDNGLYRRLLELWSDKDYGNHDHNQPAPDENFFNTFGYFGTVSDENMDLGLKIIRQRAIKENVSYIETMLTIIDVDCIDFFNKDEVEEINSQLKISRKQSEVDAILSKIDSTYTHNKNFQSKIDSFNHMLVKYHAGIDTVGFKMRYQTYAARTLPPLQVYTSLLSGFYASSTQKDSLLVGVNIVAPENNHTALEDYTLHMQMFNYLNRMFPNVNRALHAGELTLGMVRPKNLLFHIDEAIHIAKAQRIGHGVDIPYESESYELLEKIKEVDAAIEINLTSNQFILGVQGNKHPYLIYSENNIPMVIATDDSGVSRNNLANEFVLLASRYKPSYKKIKEYVYNSINYSFLSYPDKNELVEHLNLAFEEFERKIASINFNFEKG